MRRGLRRDFDPAKLLPGEWAVTTDPGTENQIVYMCFQAGVVKRMGTYEDFRTQVSEATEDIKEEYEQTFNEIKVYMEGLKNTTEGYKNTAAQKATQASNSATQAGKSASDASKGATNAANSAEASEDHAKLSESWAKGSTGVRDGENTNNSKYYSDRAKTLTDEASDLLDQAQNVVVAATQGALIPGGTVTFENLPSNPAVGYMYNISNDFTTDSRFMEGAGIFYSAGANVYWAADGKWDVMVGTQVTGIKGANQTSYQKGNVSLSADDIGAVGTGGDISSNTVTFEQAVERAGITSDDTMSVAFGKLAKYCADIENGVLNGLAGNVQNQLDLGCLRASKVLSSRGWYKILRISEGNTQNAVSASGISIDLTLCRNYNYSQPETVVMTIEINYGAQPIAVVHDRSCYDYGHALFEEIRISYDSNNKRHYLEVLYGGDKENTCCAYMSIKDSYLTNYRDRVCDFEPSELPYMWLYHIPITKDVKTNGLRKIYTGDINIDDYFDSAHVGSYGHHSGTLSGIPSGMSSIGIWDTMYSIGDGDSKYLKQTYSPYDKSLFAQRIRINSTVSDWSVFYPIPFQVYDTPYHAISSEATDWQQFLYHLWYHIQNLFNWSNIGQIDIISPGTWAAHSNFIGRFHHNPRTNCIIGTITISTEMYSLYWNPSSGDWNKVVRQRFVGGS